MKNKPLEHPSLPYIPNKKLIPKGALDGFASAFDNDPSPPKYAAWYCPKCPSNSFVIYMATDEMIEEHLSKVHHSPIPPPEFMDIKKKDIRGNHKVNIDLRKLKGSKPISEGELKRREAITAAIPEWKWRMRLTHLFYDVHMGKMLGSDAIDEIIKHEDLLLQENSTKDHVAMVKSIKRLRGWRLGVNIFNNEVLLKKKDVISLLEKK